MKLRNHQFSTQPRIFEGSGYKHPWYEHNSSKSPIMKWEDKLQLIKPNPPTKEAVERARFVDKTYHWSRPSSIRS